VAKGKENMRRIQGLRGLIRFVSAGLVALLSLSASPSRPSSAAPAPATKLRVFAAASLGDAFKEIARSYEKAHPGVAVQFNLAGSQQLAAQLQQGATADVFASADTRWMDELKDHDATGREPVVFAKNALVVIVPKTNPARIARLQDLTRRGTKFVIGADAVPVGHYSREVLANLAKSPGFDEDFARRALANVVSEEENVKAVVGKVQLGEADAGMVYRSDVTPALARYVRTFEIPPGANVLATYPIVVLRKSPHPKEAQAFVDLVLSAEGQAILKKRGLLPAKGDGPWKL
jgi:molybdate transport system substrate-binding protein